MSPGNSSEQTVSLEMSPNDKDSLTGTNEMVVTSAARPVSQTYAIKINHVLHSAILRYIEY